MHNESPTDQFLSLVDLPVGSRLLVRSRVDWRGAAVSRRTDDQVVLTVCSPSGRTYRLRRDHRDRVSLEGSVAVLCTDHNDHWSTNLGKHDLRW